MQYTETTATLKGIHFDLKSFANKTERQPYRCSFGYKCAIGSNHWTLYQLPIGTVNGRIGQ